MKKKTKKIILIALAIIILSIGGGIIGGVLFYSTSLSATGNSNEEIIFIIKSGTPTKVIIDNMVDSGLVKNKYAGYIYVKTHKGINLQAGTYVLNKGMNFQEIIKALNNGDILDDSVSITFVEGKRIKSYAKQISEKFGYSEDEILGVWNNKEYLQELIDKYWFLTDDILNDKLYYALEGYLYPNTYQFKKDASIKEITEKMLDTTGVFLGKYKSEIENSNYSVHEILSMAGIIELEAVSNEDREKVSQVIYKRLNLGMTLGMDVTTYYAVQKEMKEELWQKDLDTNNPYNTRVVSGLPVGPICNSSIESVIAVLEPAKTDYLYFYADVKTGRVYFAQNESEFQALIQKYKV